MKKLICGLLLLGIMLTVVSCNDSKITTDQIITHLEANELDKALEKSKQADLKKNSNDLVACIARKLELYIETNNWINTKYELVDPNTIEDLKKYKEILNMIPMEDNFTNVNSFVELTLSLEQYTKWNKYHQAQSSDTYLQDIQDYMNTGATYRNSSWSTAVRYYEKAYNVAESARIHYKDNDANYGMSEAEEFFEMYGILIKDVIEQEDTSTSDSNKFDSAKEKYVQII